MAKKQTKPTTQSLRYKTDYFYRTWMWFGLARDKNKIMKVASRHQGSLINLFHPWYIQKLTPQERANCLVAFQNQERLKEQDNEPVRSARLAKFGNQLQKKLVSHFSDSSYRAKYSLSVYQTFNVLAHVERAREMVRNFFMDAECKFDHVEAARESDEVAACLVTNAIYKQECPYDYANILTQKILQNSSPFITLLNLRFIKDRKDRCDGWIQIMVKAQEDCQLALTLYRVMSTQNGFDHDLEIIFESFLKNTAQIETIFRQMTEAERFSWLEYISLDKNKTLLASLVEALEGKGLKLIKFLTGFPSLEVQRLLNLPNLAEHISDEDLLDLCVSCRETGLITKISFVLQARGVKIDELILLTQMGEYRKKVYQDSKNHNGLWSRLEPLTRYNLITQYNTNEVERLNELESDKGTFIILLNDPNYTRYTAPVLVKSLLGLLTYHMPSLSELDLAEIKKVWKLNADLSSKYHPVKVALTQLNREIRGVSVEVLKLMLELYHINLQSFIYDSKMVEEILRSQDTLVKAGLLTPELMKSLLGKQTPEFLQEHASDVATSSSSLVDSVTRFFSPRSTTTAADLNSSPVYVPKVHNMEEFKEKTLEAIKKCMDEYQNDAEFRQFLSENEKQCQEILVKRMKESYGETVNNLDAVANVLISNKHHPVFLKAFIQFLRKSECSLQKMLKTEHDNAQSWFPRSVNQSPIVQGFLDKLMKEEGNEHILGAMADEMKLLLEHYNGSLLSHRSKIVAAAKLYPDFASVCLTTTNTKNKKFDETTLSLLKNLRGNSRCNSTELEAAIAANLSQGLRG